MKKLLTLLIIFTIIRIANGQTKEGIELYPTRKFTIEPGIGTNLYTLLGSTDIRFTNLIQYNLVHKIALVSHSALAFDLPNSRITDVKQNHSFTISQKFGLGTAIITKGASHNLFVLGGLKYNSYSGTLDNEHLMARSITSKTSSFSPDYGILYNLKLGRNKYFFSTRMYVPLKDGLYGILENASLEFGIGIKMK